MMQIVRDIDRTDVLNVTKICRLLRMDYVSDLFPIVGLYNRKEYVGNARQVILVRDVRIEMILIVTGSIIP